MAKKRASKDAPAVTPAPPNDPILVRANVNRQTVMSSTFSSIYANDVQVQTTPWDVRLILGEIFQAPTEAEPTAVVRQLGELRVSPQLAKKLIVILLQQLAIYEKAYGAIPQPPED